MAVYPMKKWIRSLGVVFLVLGGVLVLWPVLEGQETLIYAVVTRSIGLFFAGALILSMNLRVGADRYSSHILGFSRGARFDDITSLQLVYQLGKMSGAQNLIVRFERDGKKGKRVISKINQYENYEQFIGGVEMFSGKKVEKF